MIAIIYIMLASRGYKNKTCNLDTQILIPKKNIYHINKLVCYIKDQYSGYSTDKINIEILSNIIILGLFKHFHIYNKLQDFFFL